MKFIQLTGAGLLVLMTAATPTFAADMPVKAGAASAPAVALFN